MASREIILCESLIDAMTFWCAGYRNVIAAYGVNGFTADHWQAVLIQSSSAAGKSSLMDAVLNLVPAEERIQYSAMTGQSLFFLGETDLQHEILAIAEEEGVRQAAYALKLLQSDGEHAGHHVGPFLRDRPFLKTLHGKRTRRMGNPC